MLTSISHVIVLQLDNSDPGAGAVCSGVGALATTRKESRAK